MAPQLRSSKGLTKAQLQAHKEALRAGVANTSGLPALPVELLFEILSQLPTVPVPMVRDYRMSIYPACYLEKPQTLRALSQTCRSLRSIFLPHVWQSIEVCASSILTEEVVLSSISKLRRNQVEAELATELVRQLEIVTIRDPTLAEYVKYDHWLLLSRSLFTPLP